jgi:hypothetical protein
MATLDKIRDQFINNGFAELSNYRLPKSLLWRPDLIFTKSNYTYFVLVKSNNSIPPSFLNRISNIPKGNIIPLIVFAQKLKDTEEKRILSLGISIAYLIRGRLVHFNIKKKSPPNIFKRELKNKLKSIDIFISSKQDIDEREFIKGRIYILRDVNLYPFFPHLIEYDKFRITEIYKHIDDEMGKCEWIIFLLEENPSPYVKYEINKALKIIEHDNIFMFVKLTNDCRTTWEKELNEVKKYNSIHYMPYTNTNDLEVSLTRAVNKRMDQICKKEKIAKYLT